MKSPWKSFTDWVQEQKVQRANQDIGQGESSLSEVPTADLVYRLDQMSNGEHFGEESPMEFLKKLSTESAIHSELNKRGVK